MKAAPCWEFGFQGEEMVKEGLVNLNRGVGHGEIRETRNLARSDKLLRRPYVVGCRSH